MIPQFARFYNYTVADILNEYARVFFSLVNSMFEITAQEMLNDITVQRTQNSEDGGADTIRSLQQQAKGLSAIIDEVKVVKGVRNKK